MMPGTTKRFKLKKLNRFATDLSMRCNSEFENIHRQTAGDTEKLKERTAAVTNAIVKCYQGNHVLCKAESTVCEGEGDRNWFSENAFLPFFSSLRWCLGQKKKYETVLTFVSDNTLSKRRN